MSDPHWLAGAIAVAIAVDLLWGDPHGRWHPVAWMGSLLAWGRRRLARGSPGTLMVRGALLLALCVVSAALAGWFASSVARSVGWPGVLLEGLLLKLSFSLRDLARACQCVARALSEGDLVAARRLVGFHLVSRPTSGLDCGQVASAAIESAGENLTDALVAPLMFYLAFGLAGAYVYRAVNTADAMLGYREGALEYFGKPSARLDDVFNLIPARVSALALAGLAGLTGGDIRGAWRILVRDRGNTASPNAGWTMAAMAGALGIRLEKVGAYRLGDGRAPDAGDIARGVRLMLAAGLALGAVAVVALLAVGHAR